VHGGKEEREEGGGKRLRTSQLTKTAIPHVRGRSAPVQLAHAGPRLGQRRGKQAMAARRTLEIKQSPHAFVVERKDTFDDDDARAIEVLRLVRALVGDERVDG
jgi:hypothetical protein